MQTRVEIHSLAPGGDGVGKLPDGRTVFVPHTAAGDVAVVRVLEQHKTYARAGMNQLLTPGPGRVEAPCPIVGRCGGCAWQHLAPETQNEAKASFLRETLRRVGGIAEPPVQGVLAPIKPYGYRNKAQVPVALAPDGSVRVGYYREGSHDVEPLPEEGCRLLEPAVDLALRFVRDNLQSLGLRPYDQRANEGSLRHVMVRANARGEAMVVLVTRNPIPEALRSRVAAWAGQAGIVSVQNNVQSNVGNVIMGEKTHVLAGPTVLDEELDGLKFRLSATSFFQVNSAQTTVLLRTLEALRPWGAKDQVLELYCGVGTLSLPLGRLGVRLHGIESHGAAVTDAEANALANGIKGLTFATALAEDMAKAIPDGFAPNVALVDPPRKGLEASVVKLLAAMPSIQEIAYVSCDPASLARDVKAFATLGFKLEKVTGVDLFPQTAHVESVVLLRRV